jgi:hypothetical protein
VDVSVLGDNTAALQLDVGDHDAVAGDELSAEIRFDLFAWNIVPTVVRRGVRSGVGRGHEIPPEGCG